MKNLFTLLILLLCWCAPVHAQDASQPKEGDAGTAQAETGAQADAATKPAEPRKRHRDKVKVESRLKSKFTSDRTEEEADHRTLDPIAMGMDKIVDIEADAITSSKQIIVGNTAVVAAAGTFKDKFLKQIVIKGIGEGETNITLRKDNGDVLVIFDLTVAKQNLIRVLNDIKRNLKEVEGVEYRIEANRVVIDGEVLTPNDYGKVANVVTDPTYKDTVTNRVIMSPVSMNALAKKIEQDLQVFAQTVRVSVLNGRIILEGTVESEAIKARASKRAEWYLPAARVSDPINKDANIEKNEKPLQIIQNDIQVNVPPPKRDSKLVRLSLYFVELNKDFLKQFGFKWQPGFTAEPSISIGSDPTGALSPTNAGGFTFSGTLSSLFPTLNSVQNAGYGRILKSITAIVKSEELYNVKDTVKFPTLLTGANGAVTNGQPVDTGFDVNITPKIMQGQDVDVDVNMSQTDIVGKVINGTPITEEHKVKTRVYLKSGEVAGISALSSQEVATSFNRDDPKPGSFGSSGTGATTSPIFTLMRSKNYSKKRGQFVVFVSPQIIESASEGSEDLKKNYRMPSGH